MSETIEFHGRHHVRRDGMIYMAVRAISAAVNLNYDGWPSEELKKSYKTFINKPIFVDHHSLEEDNNRGMVVDAEYIEDELLDDKYIETLMEIDAQTYPMLAEEILSGGIDSVSMGAFVDKTICSVCFAESDGITSGCVHIPSMKGLEVNGTLCYEICKGIEFYELSLVFEPADATAIAKSVVASIGTGFQVPQSELVDLSSVEPTKIYEAWPYSFFDDSDAGSESVFRVNPLAIIEPDMELV